MWASANYSVYLHMIPFSYCFNKIEYTIFALLSKIAHMIRLFSLCLLLLHKIWFYISSFKSVYLIHAVKKVKI